MVRRAFLGVGQPVDDLGRQRHLAYGVDEVDDGARARLQALAGTHEHFPQRASVLRRRAVLAQQEHLGRSARAALRAQQAGGHDARLVRHEQVVRG